MSTCEECNSFFSIPEDADDYEPGKGDYVLEIIDKKGKYWTSKPTFKENESCADFKSRA
jgi:hypothetical protein